MSPPLNLDPPEVIRTEDHVAHLLKRVEELERLVDWLTEHIRRTPQVGLAYGYPMYIHIDPPKRKDFPLKPGDQEDDVAPEQCRALDEDGVQCELPAGHRDNHGWRRGVRKSYWPQREDR